MKVVIFGVTGMVGQGVLRECLQAADVERVLAICRTPTGFTHAKYQELVHGDFLDFRGGGSPRRIDACFFCLGVSSPACRRGVHARDA